MRRGLPSDHVREHGLRDAAVSCLLASSLAILAGCGGNEGTPAPNNPPDTEITSSAPSEGGAIAHNLQVLFRGLDSDGTTVAFETLLHTYPRSVENYDDITVQAPDDADPRWTRTEAFFADIIALADTLRADPRGDIGDGRFDRWHTFFVRAIDNEGAKDPDPAARTFNAFTLAPQVWLLDPAQVGPTVTELPRSFALHWDGLDDIGEGTIQDPLATRWVRLSLTPSEAANPDLVRDRLYDLPNEAWEDWITWTQEDSTREAQILDLMPANSGDSYHVFAVQGLDDGDAVTPQFADAPFKSNNYSILYVRSDLPVGPRVPVQETQADLGEWLFDGDTASDVQVTATAVDSVSMSWGPMQTVHYGGKSQDYRFGWNLTDLEDDDQWTSWGTVHTAPPHELVENPETFYLQGRDHLGLVTQARITFLR